MFHVTKFVLPDMLEAGRGSIINIASLGGGVLGSQNTAYATTKGGVVGFTRALVIGHAGTGIRANVICPGIVVTAMTASLQINSADLQRYVSSVPVGRTGQSGDIGGPVVLLASDASSFVNGALITLDGGVSLMMSGPAGIDARSPVAKPVC